MPVMRTQTETNPLRLRIPTKLQDLMRGEGSLKVLNEAE
jgi:hypothetical protein